jgi:hypothetical protein
MVGKIFHWISHKTGNYSGRVISWRDDKYIFIGFQCDKCGEVDKKTINVIESVIENYERTDDSCYETD